MNERQRKEYYNNGFSAGFDAKCPYAVGTEEERYFSMGQRQSYYKYLEREKEKKNIP